MLNNRMFNFNEVFFLHSILSIRIYIMIIFICHNDHRNVYTVCVCCNCVIQNKKKYSFSCN